ncbi:polysaccharide deacetylase family protein, partial [Candidatus Roizmanbacteria bacterium]|nr:polysaccharide deacetylase family protein [Candidatus Roizmanbacteria bacterium]
CALYHIDQAVRTISPFVVVLNYHSIASDGWFHSVDLSTLKSQVLTLKRLGFDSISPELLESIISGKITPKRPSVVITFDDGYKNIFQTRIFFKKLGIKPVVFLLSDTKHARRDELDTNEAFLSDSEVAALARDGWYIGSHSGTHAQLDTLQKDEMYREVKTSKAILEHRLKKKIDYFAYPKGRYNNEVLSLVRQANYKLAFSMDDGRITKNTDFLRIPRIGINRSHSLSEFRTLWSPSVIASRRIIKSLIS